MTCPNDDILMQGYLEGELDLASTLEFEAHLRECGACARAYHNHQTLRAGLRGGELYFLPGNDLSERIRSSLRRSEKVERKQAVSIRELPRPVPSWNWWAAAGLAACLALVSVLALRFIPGMSGPSRENLLAQEVLASHVRSLMLNHLTDVLSSDQHTVKPWFNGKLDFSPPVQDLSGDGFPLVGGRLDYLEHRPVAALVYQRRKHVINVFIWPADKDSGEHAVTEQGYNLVHWTRSGMTYWVASDLNTAELEDLARLMKGQNNHVPH